MGNVFRAELPKDAGLFDDPEETMRAIASTKNVAETVSYELSDESKTIMAELDD